MEKYTAPTKARIGHVHLKVSDLQTAIDFYSGLLGFEIKQRLGDQAAFLAAGDYHHHIGLNTWQSKGGGPAPKHTAGLFHTAFLYPTRKELAAIYKRLSEANYSFTGFADHGVSEALYLDDPDGNGVELYWDRPMEEWPRKENGEVDMYTRPLNLDKLLNEL